VIWSLPCAQVGRLCAMVDRLEGDLAAANTRAEATLKEVST
jgi:hypothetical protein